MTGGRAWDIAKDNLGRCPIFLFFPVKKKKKEGHVATLGGAGRKGMDMEISSIIHNHI